MTKMKKEHEGKVYYIISNQIKSWRKFGRVIGVEDNVINIIEKDYQGDNYEMAYRCIANKRETSKEVIDWPYWKEILLELDEGSIVDTIENEYPYLSAGTAEEVHKCYKDEDYLAIVAHNANRKENFLLLHCDLKEEIQLYFGSGETKLCIIMRREKLQEKLFEEHGVLLEFNKYMFSNKGIKECDVLRTAHEWLSNNNDKGFAIKGYDMKQHLQHYTGIYPCENPYKDSYVLVYSVNHNVIIHIDTDPTDINTAVKNNRMDISYLRTLHNCLVGKAILFVIVTLYDDDAKIAEISPSLCKSCEKLGLVVTKNIFKNITSLKAWWQSIEDKNEDIRKLVNKSNEGTDLTKDLIKSIIEFMIGVTSFDVPSPRFQSRTLQKDNRLVMCHPEYRDITSPMQ